MDVEENPVPTYFICQMINNFEQSFAALKNNNGANNAWSKMAS